MRYLLLILILLAGCSEDPKYDVILLNGKIIDGSGTEPYTGSVGIKNDKIVAIGKLQGKARQVINATGLVISPGFIDMHTHAVRGIFDVPTAEAFLFQGVTTLTDGNDGTSPLPIGEHYKRISSTKISPNWAVFVGQGTVRRQVMGLENRAPTNKELEQMVSIVDQAMKEGALGLSSGLFYVPGSFSTKNEVVELAKVASKYGGIYISHMRDEAALIIESVNETIDIGKLAKLPAVITHHKVIGKSNWGLSKETLKLVDNAVNQGFDVYLDHQKYSFKSEKKDLGGYSILKNKNVILGIDIGTAPESKFSENYQSGPLSFEAIYKGSKIICNSGYYQNTKKNLNLISRSTAAHSTLILNNNSIVSFKKNFRNKILNKLNFNTLNKNIVCEKNYWLIKCSHDGYLKNYGTIHERSLEFFPEKNKFVGTDKLIKNKNFIPTNFDIRFHLMPTTKVTKTQDKNIILIELENSAWRFYSVNGSIDVETGLYFGNKNDYLENQNIFISGLTEKDDQVIKWEITKIE